jgi:hypothetical protein
LNDDRTVPVHSVALPQAIWARCGLPSRIECSGGTVRTAIEDCCRRLPQLGLYLSTDPVGQPGGAVIFADGNRVMNADLELAAPTNLRVIIPSAGG